MTAAREFLVYAWPQGGWGITENDRLIPLVIDTREEAEHLAQMLADKYGTGTKAAAPVRSHRHEGTQRQVAS